MKGHSRAVFLCLLGVITSAIGCTVSELDAITRKPVGDGGLGGGGMGEGGSGGTGTGGANTANGGIGGAGIGTAGTSGVSAGTAGTSTAGTNGDGTGGTGTGSGGTSSAGTGSAGAENVGGGAGTSNCSTPPLAPGDTTETVQIGSASRSYYLHVPSTYDGAKPVPLVVDFHFLGNSGEQEQRLSPFPEVAEAEGGIVAFPNGEDGPAGSAWNIGPCCVEDDIDDVAFTKALVDQIRTKACIDEKRIYAVGYAVGGGMAHYVGCHAADVFAAIAPVGFDLLEENVDDCQPSRPITVVSFRELTDAFVPYEGGVWSTVSSMPVTLLGAEATFSKWAELNGCTGTPSDEDSNGCTTYGACAGGVEVVLCRKAAGAPVPDNGSIAWPILQRHSMP